MNSNRRDGSAVAVSSPRSSTLSAHLPPPSHLRVPKNQTPPGDHAPGGLSFSGCGRSRRLAEVGSAPTKHQREPPKRRPLQPRVPDVFRRRNTGRIDHAGKTVVSEPPHPRPTLRPLKSSGTHAFRGSSVHHSGVKPTAVPHRGCPTSSDVGAPDASIARARPRPRAATPTPRVPTSEEVGHPRVPRKPRRSPRNGGDGRPRRGRGGRPIRCDRVDSPPLAPPPARVEPSVADSVREPP